MAPEQVKGHKPDARADVWSAGAVLYEMSTGKQPFGELIRGPLIAAILERAPVPPHEVNPKISEGLERVILRALQKDPKERYQSAGDLRIDLANLATGTAPIYSQQSPASTWRRWVAIVVAAAVMLLGAAVWWVRHGMERAVTEARMMAVLPFESVANDAPTNALGLGLTETVNAKLVQAFDGGALQLVSTGDLLGHRVKTSEQARSEFGTDLVLEGLPRAVEPGRRFALQGHQDTKLAAYDFYLRGRGYLEDYQSPDNVENAIAQFEHAIAVDKNYAPAYAAMGMAYNAGYQRKNRGRDWVEKAKTECERALAITPQLAEGHTCLGKVFASTGRYE